MTAPCLPGFFEQGAPVEPEPRKAVRQVSRAQFRALQESGKLTVRQREFLEALDRYTHLRAVAPTLAELTVWAADVGRLPHADPNAYRPRATELERLGAIEYLPARACRVTGATAHPVRVKTR